MAETGNRELYIIGPLAPDGVGSVGVGLSDNAKSHELAVADNGNDCQVFMDKILGEHGEHSLIYVRPFHWLFLSLGRDHLFDGSRSRLEVCGGLRMSTCGSLSMSFWNSNFLL